MAEELSTAKELCLVFPPVVLFKKRELALLKQRPWARGADGVEGPGSAPPQLLQDSLRADRRLERKERELPRAFAWASGTPAFMPQKSCQCVS